MRMNNREDFCGCERNERKLREVHILLSVYVFPCAETLVKRIMK
jgi:hypothetical protein